MFNLTMIIFDPGHLEPSVIDTILENNFKNKLLYCGLTMRIKLT